MFDPVNYSEDQYVQIDLSDPNEFLTRIQGVESTYITKLIFTTNLGHKFECGDDYGLTLKDEMNLDSTVAFGELEFGEQEYKVKPRKFEVAMTKGAQVVCIAGVHDREKLMSLHAYFNWAL